MGARGTYSYLGVVRPRCVFHAVDLVVELLKAVLELSREGFHVSLSAVVRVERDQQHLAMHLLELVQAVLEHCQVHADLL